MGSMAGMMAGPALIGAAGKMISGRAAAAAKAAGVAKAGFAATAAAAAGLALPLLAVTAAVAGGVIAWKNYKRGQELNQATFGLTAEAAKKAGLRFTDFGAKIKETIQDAKDMAAANRMVYQSMKDGGTPFEMTIQEYKKLKIEVKKTFSEQIEALDRQPSNKVPDAVRRIKESLIAAGMSAEEATKKVYTMLQLSNKSDQAITATIGNKTFSAITDPQTAAVSAVTSFGDSVVRGDGSKEKELALNTALMATETAITDLVEKRARAAAKDLSGKTKELSYSEAEKIVLDQINKSKQSGQKITEGTLSAMAKSNPEVRKLINESDTLVGVWQKIRIQAMGFNGDLSNMSSEQAGLVARAFAATGASVESSNRIGILSKQYASLEKLDNQIKNYTKSLKGQSVAEQISDRDRSRSLNKQIEANNKLADARKKALAIAQQDADLGRQIEKTRLGIANAVAVGDTQRAQELRIDLESQTSQQQTEAQTRAIDKANEMANAPLQAALDVLSKKQEKLSDSAALAAESLDKIKEKYDKQQAAIQKVNDSMTALYVNASAAGKSIADYVKTQTGKEEAAGFVGAVESATGVKAPGYKTTTAYEGSMLVTRRREVAPETKALDLLSGTNSSASVALSKSLGGGKTLKDVVDAVNGKSGEAALRKDIKVTGDYSKTKEDKEYDGKKVQVLNAQARDAIRKRLDLQPNETFIVDGQKYRQNTTGGTPIWSGPVSKKANGGIIRGAGTATSDSIPAMLSNGEFVINASSSKAFGYGNLEKINKMAAGGRASKFNFSRESFDVKTGNASNSSYVVNQTIYASDGMDVEALSNMIVRKAEVVIGQKAKLNVKMVGQGKNI